NRMTDYVDLPNRPVRTHNAIDVVEIYPFSDYCPEAFSNSGPVIGMDAPLEIFKSRRPSRRLRPRYAEYLFGLVGVCAERRHKCPAARVTQPLRFRKISLASPQDFFAMLALGDISDRANKFQPPGLILFRSMADNMNIFN